MSMLSREVFPDLPIGLLHGRLGSAEKEAAMERFKSRQHEDSGVDDGD